MKVFKIKVDMNKDTGVDFNSFVEVPAHMRAFHAFGKKDDTIKDFYSINEEKRMVTGCMINCDMPILRGDKEIGDHYVIFDRESVDNINKKIAKFSFANNVNVDHDMSKVQSGAYQVARWIVSDTDPKFSKVPDAFREQKIADGSLFCTYWIENDELWKDVKDGKFQGFSVEGWFDKVEAKLTKKDSMKKIQLAKGKFAKISQIYKWEMEIDQETIELNTTLTRTYNRENNDPEVSKVQAGEYSTSEGKRILVDADGVVRLIFNMENKMSKKRFSFKDFFSMSEEQTSETFGTATTVDGVVLKWSGGLDNGVAVTMEVDGVATPAPEGDHEVTLEDGTKKVITLDATGAITNVSDVEEMTDVEEVANFTAELATFVKDGFETLKAEFSALKTENEALKSEITALRKGEKFQTSPKGGEENTVKTTMEALRNALNN